ncbi:hypothetical protein DRO26_03920 [Candidatus Bathyarchaeota archaeon]|nr:MAG: hypothetical protein DRO26_03920 [Candidatus Bathyarchaeota archaeon]
MVVEALGNLNGLVEIVDSDIVTSITPVICKYEVGIADGVYFNFLSWEEVENFRKKVKRSICKNIDFLVCVFYRYKKTNGKEVSLWSDFHYVRFGLEEAGKLEIKVHHFKGTRKLPLDILIKKIVEKINERVEAKGFKHLKFIRLIGH